MKLITLVKAGCSTGEGESAEASCGELATYGLCVCVRLAAVEAGDHSSGTAGGAKLDEEGVVVVMIVVVWC